MIGWPPQSAFLTHREWLALYIAAIAAVVAAVLTRNVFVGLGVAAPFWVFCAYRSQPRLRAAKRAGLLGFVQQLPAVSETERARKLDALAEELRDPQHARIWLHEVDQQLVRSAARRLARRQSSRR
jgi:hypothetical protein